MYGFRRKLVAPIACMGVLGGMLFEQGQQVTPRSVEPYHEAARVAIEAVPPRIDTRDGTTWAARDIPLPTAALQLLRPNAYLSRRYVVVTEGRDRNLAANLLIVQTRDSRDMVGHYPPKCYPSSGFTLAEEPKPFLRTIDGQHIRATEYTFTILKNGRTERQTVYNFLLVPGVGIVPDFSHVERAAEDYQQRYFGAAQYQVVMNGELPRDARERAYDTLIRENINVINTLVNENSGGRT